MTLNPNYAQGHFAVRLAYVRQGNWAECLEHFGQAQRLSPFDGLTSSLLGGKGLAMLHLGRLEDAVDNARASIDTGRSTFWAHALLAVAHRRQGDIAAARRACHDLRSEWPQATLGFFRTIAASGQFAPTVLVSLLDYLEALGLPEA